MYLSLKGRPEPSIQRPSAFIDAALERDREAASAEWLAEWRSDLADFLDRALIEAAVDPGVRSGHRVTD